MRSRPSLVFVLAASTAMLACSEVTTSGQRVYVSKVPSGVHVAREDGEPLKLTRWELDARPGLVRGYFVVDSEHEWRDLWENVEADRIPLLPHGIDFGQEMLLVAAPTETTATGARIHQAIDTQESGVHVYVSQELPGQGCPAAQKSADVPVDLARVPRTKKEIHFHVESKRDEPCAPPPEAKIACRVNGTGEPFEEKLTIPPGKSVACLAQGKPGFRPTIDRTWSFRSLPMGTAAKMTMAPGGAGVSFGTDAFGTYAIGLEVTDDLGRTAKATTDVEVAPPKDALVVQMLWTKFDPNDDPSAFPRVELHVTGEKPPPAADVAKYGKFASRPQPWILVHGDCTVANDRPPPWCKGRVVMPTSIEELATDAFPEYRIGVHYTDDRYEGQPVLCVRAFRGAQVGEWCDKTVRAAGSWWDVARIDAMTGKPPATLAAGAGGAGAGASASAPASAPASASASASAPAPASASASVPGVAPAPKPAAAPKPAPAPAKPKPKSSADPWTP